jgi:aryl-alcohol dehydrogenase-like predicted oxidoreductase
LFFFSPWQWGPLHHGFLARPPSTEASTLRSARYLKSYSIEDEDLEIIKRVEEIAKKKGWKMSQVALAWINKRVSSPIVGFSSIARMDEALEANGKMLTDDEEKYLEEMYRPKAVSGHS